MPVSFALRALSLCSVLFGACLASTPIGDSTELLQPPDPTPPPRGWVSVENTSSLTSAPGLEIATGATGQEVGDLILTGHANDSLTYHFGFTPTTPDLLPLDPHEVRNLTLWGAPLGSKAFLQLGQTIPGLTSTKLTFDLGTNPIRLHPNDRFALRLRADYYGDVNRHVQFVLLNENDLDARDAATDFPAIDQVTKQNVFPLNLTYVNIHQGSLNASRADSSPTGTVTAEGISKSVCHVRLEANGENQLLTAFTVNLNASDSLFANMTFVAITDASGTIIANAPIVGASKLGMKFDNLAYQLTKGVASELHLMIVFKHGAAGQIAPRFSGIMASGQTSSVWFSPNDVDCNPLTVVSN